MSFVIWKDYKKIHPEKNIKCPSWFVKKTQQESGNYTDTQKSEAAACVGNVHYFVFIAHDHF